LSEAARAEAGGDTVEVLRQIGESLGRPGTYAAVVGDQFRAGSTTLPRGAAPEIATRAFETEGDNGVAATLEAFVAGVGRRAQGDPLSRDGDDPGLGSAIVLLVLCAGAGVLVLAGRRKRRRQ